MEIGKHYNTTYQNIGFHLVNKGPSAMSILIPRPRNKPPRLAVLISGSGTTLHNIVQTIARGELTASVVCVISSRDDAYGLQRAASLNISAHVVQRRHCRDVEEFSACINSQLLPYAPDLICLAGFLSLWKIPPEYQWKTINIHPALLPRFGGHGMHGKRVHQAVIDAGETISGCTVHFADNQYDSGPIILQRTCPVMPKDTPDSLAQRVFVEECIAYPEAIRLWASGRISLNDAGHVAIAPV